MGLAGEWVLLMTRWAEFLLSRRDARAPQIWQETLTGRWLVAMMFQRQWAFSQWPTAAEPSDWQSRRLVAWSTKQIAFASQPPLIWQLSRGLVT